MFSVVSCIVIEHDLRLVILAAVVCFAGASATLKLLGAEAGTGYLRKFAWTFLAAVTAGSSIWSTHFVAMLAYEPKVPVSFDPVLTIESLIIAVGGALFAFLVAGAALGRWAPALGGALLGLAVSAMHYVGMQAYMLDAIVEWDRSYVAASVLLAMAFGATSLHIAAHRPFTHSNVIASTLLFLGIVALHFTGMTALKVTPLMPSEPLADARAYYAMAIAVAVVGFVVTAAGAFSHLIDHETRGASRRMLRDLALHDALTGLPNRAAFTARLKGDMSLANAPVDQLAAVIVDIDRFEAINEMHGHNAGDTVLRQIAQRLGDLAAETRFVARMGGDEFAAVLRFQRREELDVFITEIRNALLTRVDLPDADVIIDATLGIALYPRDAEDPESLIGNAHLALARAKADPLCPVGYYEREMDETMRLHRTLASDLRLAIVREELELHYQVQKSVGDGRITGYETLLRWTHAVHGNVPPSKFIPIAEENGTILALGEWVLRTACREAASWPVPFRIAVNLSPIQFAASDLASLIETVLDETGLPPHRLELELTESTFLRDPQRSQQTLHRIRALGVAIALDDFGTGYSSLETLRKLPFDKIKLDKSFMAEVETDPQSRAIARAVLTLGRDMRIPVLAEGVETQTQLDFLRAEGCDEAQGYYLGRPVPVSAIDAVCGRPVVATSSEDTLITAPNLTPRLA